MDFFGSQFGILIFIIIGFVVVAIINAVRDKDLSEDSSNEIVGCFFKLGIIVAIICACIVFFKSLED